MILQDQSIAPWLESRHSRIGKCCLRIGSGERPFKIMIRRSSLSHARIDEEVG